MKQFKKILCGVMLTSFVILGSVSVFADFGGNGDGDGGGGDDCVHQQIVESISTETAKTHKDIVNADLKLNVGHRWRDDAGEDTPPVPADRDDDGIPDIIYKLVHSNEAYLAECADGTTIYDGELVEVRCTQRTTVDITPAEAVITNANTKDEIKENYDNCDDFDYSVRYTFTYKETDSCDCLCPDNCVLTATHTAHITTCQSETNHTRTLTSYEDKTYSEATGNMLYGNINSLNWTPVKSMGTFDTKDEAIAAINAQFGDDFQELYENRPSHEINLTRTQTLIGEDGVIENGFVAYYVYDDVEQCRYFARQEIISLIVKGLIDQGYYNVSSSANNAHIINGCRDYKVGYDMWYGYNGGDDGSTAHNKLTDNYSYKDMFIKDNNTYAILFPFSTLAKVGAVDVGPYTGSTEVMGINARSNIWNENWDPIIIEFKEHMVYSEIVEGSGGLPAYQDVTIGKANGSVDVFLQNLTHPDSPFGTKKYFPLNKDVTGYEAFSAIRANYDGKSANETLVYQYSDGSSMGFRLNEGESAFFSSGVANVDALYGIQGDNLVTATPYSDIYTQRVFRVNEHRNLFAYVVDGHGNNVFSSGDYVGLRSVPTLSSSTCEYAWRALYNVYYENVSAPYVTYGPVGPVNIAPSSTGLKLTEYTYINENIYSTMDDHTAGMPILNGAMGFSYDGNEVRTTIRSMLLADYDYETIFQDIIRKEANFTGLKTSKNGIRNAIWLNSENAGEIYFEDGTHKVDYKIVPSHIKPSRTNGSASGMLQKYGIELNGIYVLAQARLDDDYTALVTVPYNTTSITEISSTTRKVRYTICIGQHNCDCEDINVLCECQDEIAGCNKPDTCEEDPTQPGCQSDIDCTENPNDPACGCFNDIDGDCGCPEDANGIPLEDCDIWQDFEPDPTCIETGKPCTPNPPGGITGEGSEEYFDRFYKPSSTVTN